MPARVLVVVESKVATTSLRKYLEAAGWKVDAATAEGAMKALDPEAHEVVVAQSGAGGEALVPLVKAAAPSTPVVLLFPPDEDDADTQALAAGADGLLVVPLHKPTVVTCVKAMARVRALVRQIADLERRLEASAPRSRAGDAPATRASPGRYDFELFKKLLLMEVKRSKRYRYPISLAVVAVDRWRETATKLEAKGRARLLGELLTIITRAVRDIDLPLLFAEEKFLVFMPHTPGDGAMNVARRLCGRIREHRGAIRVTASVGVAAFEGEGQVSFADIIKAATEALRNAQLEGGDRPGRAGGSRKRNRVVIG
jgi:two-component system, cell cycle response regulator